MCSKFFLKHGLKSLLIVITLLEIDQLNAQPLRERSSEQLNIETIIGILSIILAFIWVLIAYIQHYEKQKENNEKQRAKAKAEQIAHRERQERERKAEINKLLGQLRLLCEERNMMARKYNGNPLNWFFHNREELERINVINAKIIKTIEKLQDKGINVRSIEASLDWKGEALIIPPWSPGKGLMRSVFDEIFRACWNSLTHLPSLATPITCSARGRGTK